jgi:hypothetical protein
MMALLGDLGYVESRFGLFADSVNLDTILVHGLRRTYHRLRKSFWMHSKELLGDVGHVDPHFDLFGDSVSVGAR